MVNHPTMLETISRGFRNAKARLTGVAELNDDNIEEALRDVRMSLLEADVEFNVVKKFLDRVKEKAVGQEVKLRAKAGDKALSATPDQHFVKICMDELVALMGPVDTDLNWAKKGPTVIMMVGLQGSGKTTTVGKLARWLEKNKRRPMLVAADIYRPAAIEQLKVLGDKLGMPVFSLDGAKPPDICEAAVKRAYETNRDVVILDTAGRLAIDEPLMAELDDIKKRTTPEEVFFVIDAMIGQDAVNTARTFNDRVGVTGVILTKLDGDARGGAALSIKEVTGKPIKFLGMGEALDKLEEFRPEGLASRILGMGDIVGLMKDFEGVVDAEKAEEDAVRMLKGKFDMQDFLDQIRMIQKMGSLKDLFEKMPFFPGGLPEGVNLDDKELVKIEAIISSMTTTERRRPEVFVVTSWETITSSQGQTKKRRGADYDERRVKRIARGSGRQENDVRELLNKFAMMRQMMLSMGQQSGLLGKIPGFKQIAQMRNMAKQMSGIDLGQIMNAAGMQVGERKFTVPKANSSSDKNKEKRKRKEARKARKKNRR
jgi:signal recognition particle subunit SRP54